MQDCLHPPVGGVGAFPFSFFLGYLWVFPKFSAGELASRFHPPSPHFPLPPTGLWTCRAISLIKLAVRVVPATRDPPGLFSTLLSFLFFFFLIDDFPVFALYGLSIRLNHLPLTWFISAASLPPSMGELDSELFLNHLSLPTAVLFYVSVIWHARSQVFFPFSPWQTSPPSTLLQTSCQPSPHSPLR